MAAADASVSLLDVIRRARLSGDVDFLKEACEIPMQALIEMKASEKIGARRYERVSSKTTYRNGYREKAW